MEHKFTKTNEGYVAEFAVTNNFNLHIELVKGGIIRVYQRGITEGLYELSFSKHSDEVFDYDFGALVYPKWIKVVSSTEVVKCEVTQAEE